MKNKILIIVGPTSSGKSELAVRLASHFNGEIISCDSRQIYRGMDLGTGKIPGKWKKIKTSLNHGRDFNQYYFYKEVVHHLIDFVNPKRQYSAALFQQETKKVIADIIARGRLPILCGGTAQWIDAVVYDQKLPDVKPDAKLRRRLEKLSTECLFARISRLDPKRAKTIDKYNRRRLIRALEIVISTGKPVPQRAAKASPYDALWIGVNQPQSTLFTKIKTRLKQRLKQGMVKEVQRLHNQLPLTPSLEKRGKFRGASSPFSKGEAGRGLSWRRLESFGLEYKFVALYLQKKLTHDQMFEQLLTAIKQYSKRQMTWWKRNEDIRWINRPVQATRLAKIFLK